jgi:hypothetical protein
MLGIGRHDVYGLPLDAFLCTESARRIRSAISGVDADVRRPSCLVKLCPKDGPERSVLASIGKDPAADRYLVSLTYAGDEQEHQPKAS